MGAIIFAFSYLGNWLDENHPHPRVYYNKILVLVGVALALYNVIRQVNEMNKRSNFFNKHQKKNSCKRCDVLVVEMMLRLYAVTAKI
jgi:hypothetical protein